MLRPFLILWNNIYTSRLTGRVLVREHYFTFSMPPVRRNTQPLKKKNVYFCCKSSNLFIYVSYLFSKCIFYQFRWRYKYFNCSSCKNFFSLLYMNSIVWNVENCTKDGTFANLLYLLKEHTVYFYYFSHVHQPHTKHWANYQNSNFIWHVRLACLSYISFCSLKMIEYQ